MCRSIVIALAAMVIATPAWADPLSGRQRGKNLNFKEVGIAAAMPPSYSFTIFFVKRASPENRRMIKIMGDALLRAPRGEKLAAMTWMQVPADETTTPPRPASRFVMIAHIDGGPQDDGTITTGISDITAKIDFCRVIWMMVIKEPPSLTLDQVVEALDREVQETVPYFTPEMEKKHSWVRYSFYSCKMTDSEEWRFIRGGDNFGMERWVYLGRYTPGLETHPKVEIRSIPNHRRNRAAKAQGRKINDLPVNRYDAALIPTPGDASKMTGMGKTGADSVAAVVEAVTASLLTAPIPLETGEILTFHANGSLTGENPQTGETRDSDAWKVWSDAEERVILEYGSTRIVDEEITAFLRRRPKKP